MVSATSPRPISFLPASSTAIAGRCSSVQKARSIRPATTAQDQILLPEAEFKDYKAPAPSLPRIKGDNSEDRDHKQEWVEAIRAGKPSHALSNFQYASTLTESMLLGNVAVRSGEVIDYDPATGRITNSSTASQYLKPYFRKGWEI